MSCTAVYLSICSLEHCRTLRSSTTVISRGHRSQHLYRCPCIALVTDLTVLSHVGLAHIGPDCVVRNSVHDGVRVDPVTELRAPVLLLELGAEYGRDGAVPQLRQFQRHGLNSVSGLSSNHTSTTSSPNALCLQTSLRSPIGQPVSSTRGPSRVHRPGGSCACR